MTYYRNAGMCGKLPDSRLAMLFGAGALLRSTLGRDLPPMSTVTAHPPTDPAVTTPGDHSDTPPSRGGLG
ncbi:hypothetical protein HEK131_29780 [Streptomyces seoulensis]|nr:hypothetical protein HEK131_29780 [Streptomyces seoulensis]